MLVVIPPGTTCTTGSDPVDGTVNLTSSDDTRCYLPDGWEPTHTCPVAGSRPASPTKQCKRALLPAIDLIVLLVMLLSFHRSKTAMDGPVDCG